MITSRAVGLAALTLFLACGSGGGAGDAASDKTVQTSTVSVSQPVPINDSGKRVDPCPRTGLWAQCSLEKRLSQSGFVVRGLPDSARRRSGFSVVPVAYLLGRSRLDVFIYPTADAAARDAARLDTTLAGPRGARNQWGFGVQPTFVRSANLLAVYLTDNPTQSERLTLALTAGAPQP
ncbi:MAG TPA: hypothetical protein VJ865_15260 [Gemmatimonadaceae bacterium]|nr:hypothetical protein [Gemmatimonadaceae bacterium]